MKRYLLAFLTLIASTAAFAQPKLYDHAIISTTTNIIVPEDEEQNNAGGGGNMFRNMFDGEIKFTTYLKGDKVKTTVKSDVIRAMIFRDNKEKMTTTVFEMMGKKQGFYISDSEQVEMKKRMDSVRESRRKNDSAVTPKTVQQEQQVEIVPLTDTKKIAGYECKKAYIITTKFLGIKDTVVVWYSPDIKFQNISFSGGLSFLGGMANMGANTNGLSKLEGFVMRFETNLQRNRRMEVEVTKIDTNKEIADKEFEIPKEYEIKPMKEMQGMFGGRGGFGRPN